MTAEYSVGHYMSRLTAIDHWLGDGTEHLRDPRRTRSTTTPSSTRCRRAKEGPLAHPTEVTDPCCLPALGELGDVSPREGLSANYTELSRCVPSRERPVTSSAEDSHSGLVRSLGKRVE